MHIAPPSGMRHDLARKLIEDAAFAHMWLCHEDGVCPDGCDTHADPKRRRLYEEIVVCESPDDIARWQNGRAITWDMVTTEDLRATIVNHPLSHASTLAQKEWKNRMGKSFREEHPFYEYLFAKEDTLPDTVRYGEEK